MLSKRLLIVPVLVFMSGLALAACGGSSTNEDPQVEKAIESSATSNDPAACTKLQTQKFAEQTTQEAGKGAVHLCEQEAKEGRGTKSVSVSNVDVSGSTATGEVTLEGGRFDGQTVEVELVKDGNQWKLNELLKFTKFDRAKLIEAYRRELPKIAIGFSPKVEECVLEAFEEASQAELEEAVLKGSGGGLEHSAVVCSLKS